MASVSSSLCSQSSKFLASRFPGVLRTKVIFQDFPRGVGTLNSESGYNSLFTQDDFSLLRSMPTVRLIFMKIEIVSREESTINAIVLTSVVDADFCLFAAVQTERKVISHKEIATLISAFSML